MTAEEKRCGEERRKAHEGIMDGIKKDVVVLFGEFNKSIDFRGQARVAGLVGVLIFASSFLYTYNHKQYVEREYRTLYGLYHAQQKDIGDLKAQQLVTNERYNQVLSKITEVSNRMGQLVNILAKGDSVQKVYLENYEERGGP